MAFVLSSLSGNLISAASAGFAPTNSADVSAIASAYQVVSATATQLNAGTAYVTSINDAPISAARAGNAANASLATSAWYDGTGRLISALPDEATVSSIASAYAESAASSKQDTLSFSYDDDKISAINGSALAGQGGGGGLVTAIGTSESGITSINNSGLVDTAALRSADYSSLYVQEPLYISASGDSSYIGISGDIGGVDSATCSAIASAYAESAASGKLDTTAQVVSAVGTETAYTPDGVSDVVTSINGNYISALSAESALQASYDEVGRELASLASEYAVSSIASSYAESAVSSKADSSALSSYVPYSSLEYNTASAISGINGSALAAGSTYSAGEGIDITDDVISVEAPVDIVAGPGIVIDNPDGNTLRVSTDENYETVLWSGDDLSATVSESLTNFESIKVYAHWHYNGSYEARTMTEIPSSATNFNLFTITPAGTTAQTNNANVYTLASLYGINGLNLTPINKSRIQYAAAEGSFSCISYSNSDVLKLYKIVGIHRIANN